MANFSDDLERFTKKALTRAETIHRKVGIEVASAVIRKTPVDTGRARANWLPSLGYSRDDTKETFDKSGQVAVGAATQTFSGAKLEQTLWLSNNLPYIQRLETGYSKQAPAGMVAVTIAEWQGIVGRVVKFV